MSGTQRARRATGAPRRLVLLPLLASLLLAAPPGTAAPRAVGHLLWLDPSATLMVARPDGTATRPLPLPPYDQAADLAVSPRGDRVAFILWRGTLPELWVAAADGSAARQLTAAVHPADPTWSPDGRRIAYTSALSALRVIGADGAADRLVHAVVGQLDTPAWSPRSSEVVYAHNAGYQGVGLEAVDVDAAPATARRLADTRGERTFHPRWAPDGSGVSYLLADGLYVVDRAGRRPTRLVDGADPTFAGGAVWSPDGRELLVCPTWPMSWHSGLRGDPLTRVDVTRRTAHLLSPVACLTPAWSPDGRAAATVDHSQGRPTTRLVIRSREGRFLADLGPAWGIGLVWTRY